MSLAFALIAGLFGLLIGSFLNACIYRLPRDIPLWSPARISSQNCEATIPRPRGAWPSGCGRPVPLT